MHLVVGGTREQGHVASPEMNESLVIVVSYGDVRNEWYNLYVPFKEQSEIHQGKPPTQVIWL